MDTRIDFKTAEKIGLLEKINWKTKYGNFNFYVRRGMQEVQYNVGTNVSKNPNSGEYIKPFTSPMFGEPLNVSEILDREDTWLDIGGHMGFFAARMLKQFPKIKKVYAYEALPHNMSFGIQNIKENGLEGSCEFIQKAIVSDNSDNVPFFISTDSGKHSIVQIRGREQITVPAININEAIKQHGITAFKMDVEGAEYELIKAIEDWSNIRIAIVEWHFMYRPNKNNRVPRFQEMMEIFNNNFDEVRVIPNVEHGKYFITHFVGIKKDK